MAILKLGDRQQGSIRVSTPTVEDNDMVYIKKVNGDSASMKYADFATAILATGVVTDIILEDADTTAENGKRYVLNASVFTADHTIDVSGVTTYIEIVNNEDTYYLNFTGADVYVRGQDEPTTYAMANATTRIELINGILTIVN